ncbi:hypothetical protein BOTBODRAFT_38482 [Botryobasidium botryosum FD-172 SS1]|uniref:Eukaryotic translation initiation factor 3 subunit A n=1 Tax=Botryobasidium botryosum (strain FD-172 SS1) TaxID=930990 RepID=A0A067M8B1_BOTB1|nr:hypothetical protein BOTBODRAFT_38482 [Botryobasidium botryosum FD-172 SS1]
MAPFTKPEAVLKQAEGLVSVGQAHAALQSITEMFTSKRFRSTPLASLEPIMLRFVELCVNMRKGRTAKEGLMQYKNIAQNTSVGSIEVVIKKFVQLADAKVQEAQAAADKAVALLDIDDLEASETPESVLLGVVSGDQSKDRTDRALVTPWLKFLWESYRTALETLKNNARLEAIYQQIAAQAFKFCLKHQRKVEFRRLCETLRLHLVNVAKYSHQPHSINLSDPDTLQRHLDTRFAQLNTSVELELWQEAFRSVEDIHNLLTLAKKSPRPAMMANYYEKLSKIFLMSGNALYHAAALSQYYEIVRATGGKSEEELSKLAGLVLVSAIAVPITADAEDAAEEGKSKNARLSALLSYAKMPTRSGLLHDALARNTLKLCPEKIRTLHKILQLSFPPLTICSAIAPIFDELAADPAYAPYLPLLNRVLLSRLFHQLSQVYSSIKIEHVLDLVAPLNQRAAAAAEGGDATSALGALVYDQDRIEAFLMGCAKRGELDVRVDHAEGSITFVTELFSSAASTSTEASQLSPATLVRTGLSRLANTLHASLQHLEPPSPPPTAAAEFQALLKAANEERKRLSVRRALASRRVELLSELTVRKEKEELSKRAEASRKEKEEETKRAAEALKRREAERVRREMDNAKKEEALTLAKSLMAKGGLKVAVDDIENLDTTKLVALQVEHLDKEKREMNERIRIASKRIDHLERAFRKEERPLLDKDYERQQADDEAAHKNQHHAIISALKQEHESNMANKKRMARMMGDYQAQRKVLAGQREEEFQRKREEAQVKIDKEKAERREKVMRQREEERRQKEAEEERRREEREREEQIERERIEEEERVAAEEEAARAAEEAQQKEKADAALAMRKQREAERAEANETARLQQQREEEAERRREERRAAEKNASIRPSAFGSPRLGPGPERESTDVWRRPSARPATPPSAPATRYRPPGARGTETDARPASPAGPPVRAAPAAAGGGWRAREAAKNAGEGSTSPAPEKDTEGFQTVAPKASVWRPRMRGSGEAPPR